jgi:hypothetical protein
MDDKSEGVFPFAGFMLKITLKYKKSAAKRKNTPKVLEFRHVWTRLVIFGHHWTKNHIKFIITRT